jgi:hypothetical protein
LPTTRFHLEYPVVQEVNDTRKKCAAQGAETSKSCAQIGRFAHNRVAFDLARHLQTLVA